MFFVFLVFLCYDLSIYWTSPLALYEEPSKDLLNPNSTQRKRKEETASTETTPEQKYNF